MAKTATKEKEENTTNVKGMFIQRIQLKEGRGIVTYSNDTDNALNAGTFTGKDECTEEFKNLFQNTKDIFGEILPIFRTKLADIRKRC